MARQSNQDFEVIVIDAASTDETVERIEQARPSFPVPLRVTASKTRLPIGAARNLGVGLARAPLVAFLSADAELDVEWVEQALASLDKVDMVFGRQVHKPTRWTLGACVRDLRYDFPVGPTSHPLRYASNVAAAYRKEILTSFPFDPWANAAEDLLLAKRAVAAGFRGAYNARLVVNHHDVPDARAELRKNLREGYGCGVYRRELGLQFLALGWGAALAMVLALLILSVWRVGGYAIWGALLFSAVLWLPALRRGLRRHVGLGFARRIRAIAATPFFDVAFLMTYAWGLLHPRRDTRETRTILT